MAELTMSKTPREQFSSGKGEQGEGPGRLLAVGDIHGSLERLKGLMALVRPEGRDRVVFLGDYIDRGPDGKGVIDYLIAFGVRFPNSIFLKGNHEEMFLDFLNERDQLGFLVNGGETTLASYRKEGGINIPKAHLDFLEKLPTSFETDQFIFVHAGLRPGLPLRAQREGDMLWIRDEFIRSNYNWGKVVVFGHTPLRTPLFTDNKIGIDTGAAYGESLTCCDVERRRCWQYP